MVARTKTVFVICSFLLLSSETVFGLTIDQQALSVTPEGSNLATMIDSMDVVNRWDEGFHISWFSGEPNNARATSGVQTHCSAFAAAVAERLGVGLLRPPNWGQGLLANAQHKWINSSTGGLSLGWRITTSLVELQAAANKGMYAVISKQNLNASLPGHIAVVRPNAANSTSWLLTNGPQMAQSGSTNYNNVTAKKVFNLTASNVFYAIYDRQVASVSLPYHSWTATNRNKTFYLVDSNTAGRIDGYRLEYTGTSGLPTWYLSAGGLGKTNSSSWAPWYKYTMSNTTTSEPYAISKSGYVRFAPNATALNANDNGTVIASTATIVTAPVAGITGLWYAAFDNLMYGAFLTNSNSTHLGGYALVFSAASGAPEFQQLDLVWTTPGSVAAGSSKRCTWAANSTITTTTTTTTSGGGNGNKHGRKLLGKPSSGGSSGGNTTTTLPATSPSCTVTSASVTLQITSPGAVASITGLPNVPANTVLEKATVLTPSIGPVAT